MTTSDDHPGVWVPPPAIYIAFFGVAIFAEHYVSIRMFMYDAVTSKVVGILGILIGLVMVYPALILFFRSKSTIVTMRPVRILQTSGIYSYTRNPIYIGMFIVYIGLSFLLTTWWPLLLLPGLFLVIQEYVVKREEKYLFRKFGQEYADYSSKVRRWI